jgi:predicted Zn-dependent protease
LQQTDRFGVVDRLVGMLVVVLVLVSGGCATNPVTGKQDFVLMSEDKEIQLGQQAHQEILKQYTVYDDPDLQRYVSRIGDQLAQHSHRSDLDFHFTVLDSPEVNAFALPGGYVYITRGILAYVNSEAELAGILGHEIGHVTARHSVRQHGTEATANTVTNVLGVLVATQAGSVAGSAAGNLSNVAGTALVRGYGREHELEADRLGAEYLAKTGYGPQEMLKVVGVLKSQEEFEKQQAREQGRKPRIYHGVFATHPDNDQRLQEVIAAARQYQSAVNLPTNRDAYLRHVDGMVFGPSEQEGVLRGRRFYHRPLNVIVSFPKGWVVENLPDRLLARTPDNTAMVQMTMQSLYRTQSSQQLLLKQFGASKLTRVKSVPHSQLDGYTGITLLATPWGRKPARVAVVVDGKRVYQFAAASKTSLTTSSVDTQVLETIASLRALRPVERELAEPKRIRLVSAQPGDNFSNLAGQTSLGQHAVEKLQLLNGKYPNGQPQPGDIVKIVR